MLARIHQCVDALRERSRARYGWTHLEVRVELATDPASVRLIGQVAVPSLASQLRALITEQLPDLVIELALTPMPVLDWRECSNSVELWAEHPSQPTRSLATQLCEADGPVGRLADSTSGVLVRARDGTVGWVVAELGPIVAARPLGSPTLPSDPGRALVDAARAYLGVPYVLGGTSPTAIDCSGVVSRAYARAVGVVLPRNSNDQLAITGGELLEHVEAEPGDLLFLRSRKLGRTHVGLATGAGTIIHASRTRNGVIEESEREFESDAQWLRRIRWPAIVEWSRGQAGRDHVELPSGR